MLKQLYAALLIGAVSLTGCGYSMGAQETSLPPEVRSIAIRSIENTSNEPGIENIVTAQVIREFSRDGRLKVQPEETADSILTATITGYSAEPVSFDGSFRATAYKATITLSYRFEDTVGLGLERGGSVAARARYQTSSSLTANEKNKQISAEKVGELLGQNLIGALLEGF